MFTARVPGLGLVEWSPDRVEAYAHELARTHRPERLSIRWRGRWVFRLPLPVEHACKHCTEPWPCPSAWWAERYQTSQARYHSPAVTLADWLAVGSLPTLWFLGLYVVWRRNRRR